MQPFSVSVGKAKSCIVATYKLFYIQSQLTIYFTFGKLFFSKPQSDTIYSSAATSTACKSSGAPSVKAPL